MHLYFVVKEIEQNQLAWYGHVQRMAEGRLHRKALKWMPKQKRALGRPKKNCKEGIKKAMNEGNLNKGQWEDRKQWILVVGQRRKTIETDIHTFQNYLYHCNDCFNKHWLSSCYHVMSLLDAAANLEKAAIG